MIEPHLWFDDFAAAVDWYVSVLGFEVATWYPDEKSATWCQMRRGDQPLMIAVTPSSEQTVGNQSYLADVKDRLAGIGAPLSLYLTVENAAEIHSAAVEKGTEIVEPLWEPWWGGRQFTLVDPAGTWWTVYEPGDAQ